MAANLRACVIRVRKSGEDIHVLAVSEGRLIVADSEIELQEFFGAMYLEAVSVSSETELPTVRPHQLLDRREVEG